MKKTYMTPTVVVMKTELEQMISVSPAGTAVRSGSASSGKDVLANERFIEELRAEEGDEELW